MTSPQEAGMSLTREQIDDILPSTGEMKVDALLCYRARDVKALCDMALRSIAPEGQVSVFIPTPWKNPNVEVRNQLEQQNVSIYQVIISAPQPPATTREGKK